MGVHVNTYVMWGVLLPYEPFKGKYDDLEPHMDDRRSDVADAKTSVKVLYDGMNGKYVAIGRIVERTGSHGVFHEPINAASEYIDAATGMLTGGEDGG